MEVTTKGGLHYFFLVGKAHGTYWRAFLYIMH